MTRGRGRPPKQNVSLDTGSSGIGRNVTEEVVVEGDATTTVVELEVEVDDHSEMVVNDLHNLEKPKGRDTKIEDAPKSENLWVDVIRGNRVNSNGIQLQFVALKIFYGKPEVEIVAEDVESEVRFWDTSLIMHAIGS